MELQNSTANRPRRRGPFARLRAARIRTRLGLILIVPIAALIAAAAVQVVGTGREATQSRDTIQYAQLADRAASLGEALQTERTLAAVLLTTPEKAQDSAVAAYADQTMKTNRQVAAYREARAQLGTPTASVTGLLKRIDTQVDALPSLRKAVDKRNVIPLSTAVFSYRSLIADLLAYRQTLANIAGSDQAANLTRAASAIASHTEMTSQEQEAGIVILAGGGDATPAQHETFQATLEGQAEALRSFSDAVGAGQVTAMERTLAGKGVDTRSAGLGDMSTQKLQDNIVAAQRYEGDISRATEGTAVTLSGGADRAEWTKTMATRVALSRAVEKRLDTRFRALVQQHEAGLLRQLAAESTAVLLIVLVAVAIALLTARGMARSLHRLRVGALSVAYQSLPQSVALLRDPGTLGSLTPDDVVANVRDVVPMAGHDEIGQVSEAFNVVHREAVRIAAEQAALRGSVSTMFVNLARRSQLMVDRLIGRLDKVEVGEEDPDRLSQLFELDHLATQMRRNDENLLVLAGAETSQRRRGQAPLGDVLRAAQSQVDQYTRIELGTVDLDVDVVGTAVNDLVHLIAELLDNATKFSAPDTTVTAEACWIGQRAFVTIADQGLGIAPDQMAELNERLADPPPVDAALSRTMGLVVVGRLAKRLGASVELRTPSGYSTMAEVIIPSEILQIQRRPRAVEAPPARSGSASGRHDMGTGRHDLADRWPAAGLAPRTVDPPRRDHPEPTPNGPARPVTVEPVSSREAPVQEPAPTLDRVDETAELPLFREVQSGWFRTVPYPVDQPAPHTDEAATVPAAPARPTRPSAADAWRTPADEGWRAASAMWESEPAVTDTGLPRRDPMARLVPGAVGSQPAPARCQRSADRIRGTLSSYHRGLQRGRGATNEDAAPSGRPDTGPAWSGPGW